jgi:hypothetical protein
LTTNLIKYSFPGCQDYRFTSNDTGAYQITGSGLLLKVQKNVEETLDTRSFSGEVFTLLENIASSTDNGRPTL